MTEYDLLVVGAGPAGSVIAERAARVLGWRCLVIDKRRHVAGNCHDRAHSSGVLVHQYGPHYFRTNNAALLDYLSNFTAFHPAEYIVQSSYRGKLFPFPINLNTLEMFFGRELTPDDAQRLLDSKRIQLDSPQNSEEFVLSRVGRELYEAFYRGYTQKQWGCDPRELDASVCGRVPVRLSRDNRYVDHRFQVMPSKGFTAMFAAMLEHPNIELRLGCDFSELRQQIKPRYACVYSGPIDEYFDYRLGRLPWRSLSFDFRLVDKPWQQPCVQLNFPNEHAYTRSIEIKHVTRQEHPQTVVVDEYPEKNGEPYYPVPSVESRRSYERYRELAELETRERHVYFCGRLAEYRYVNTDETLELALSLFERLRRTYAPGTVPDGRA